MLTSTAPPFRHVLLTRFNTRRDAGSDPPGESWLQERWTLFERFCVRSVRAQQCTEFDWLVFFDAGTPEHWRSRADGVAAAAGFRVVYVDGPFDAVVAARSIRALGLDSAPYLITSRIDNDDAIAPHFVGTVQRAFRPTRLEFVNLPLGYQLSGRRLFLRPYVASSFVSLLEAVDGPARTVYFTEHHLIGRHPVRQVWSLPAWLQVIHGGNIANVVRGIPVSGGAAAVRFDLGDVDVDTTPPSLRSRLVAAARFAGRGLANPAARTRAMSALRPSTHVAPRRSD